MYYLEKIKDFILRKKYLLLTIIVVIIILIIISALIFRKKDDRIEEIIPIEKEKIVEETKECKVKVDIKGYINKPDLYEVDCNARVEDVIKLANGLKEEADTSVINLSKKVFDEMVIYIYSTNEVKNFVEVKKEEKIKEEKCVTQAPIKNDACVCPNNKLETTVTIINEDTNQNEKSNSEENIENKKVSLNKATKEELMTLKGIGESKALAIIKYREENNGFKELEELMKISGIGEKVFEKIKDNIEL